MTTNAIFKPKLTTQVNLTNSDANEETTQAVLNVLKKLDGTKTVDELAISEQSLSQEEVYNLVQSLEEGNLLDDCAPVDFVSGLDFILEIEDLVESYAKETLYVNPFWELCMNAQTIDDLPEKLAIGMIIENWHFLFRESYFDAPVLSYVPNVSVRLILNEFFSEEYGHDDILLRALNFAGFSRQDMLAAIPLPETMGLCNALAYWAHTDPLFFFTTLGLLEGQDRQYDSFILACERVGHSDGLVGPIKAHADINIKSEHGSLTRSIFQNIPAIHQNDAKRLKQKAKLFVDLYNRFYSGVLRYYLSDAPTLRTISLL